MHALMGLEQLIVLPLVLKWVHNSNCSTSAAVKTLFKPQWKQSFRLPLTCLRLSVLKAISHFIGLTTVEMWAVQYLYT